MPAISHIQLDNIPTLERDATATVDRICKRDHNQSKRDLSRGSAMLTRSQKNPEPALVLWHIDNNIERESAK